MSASDARPAVEQVRPSARSRKPPRQAQRPVEGAARGRARGLRRISSPPARGGRSVHNPRPRPPVRTSGDALMPHRRKPVAQRIEDRQGTGRDWRFRVGARLDELREIAGGGLGPKDGCGGHSSISASAIRIGGQAKSATRRASEPRAHAPPPSAEPSSAEAKAPGADMANGAAGPGDDINCRFKAARVPVAALERAFQLRHAVVDHIGQIGQAGGRSGRPPPGRRAARDPAQIRAWLSASSPRPWAASALGQAQTDRGLGARGVGSRYSLRAARFTPPVRPPRTGPRGQLRCRRRRCRCRFRSAMRATLCQCRRPRNAPASSVGAPCPA